MSKFAHLHGLPPCFGFKQPNLQANLQIFQPQAAEQLLVDVSLPKESLEHLDRATFYL